MDSLIHAMMNGKAPTADVNRVFRAVYVGTAGDVTVVGLALDGKSDGNTVTYTNVPVGVHPIGGKRIVAATTTAVVDAVQFVDADVL